jgi:hypothetical protein
MDVKKGLGQRIRGWLPKEPVLSTYQTLANSENSLMARWMARAIVVGTVASGLLGVFGSQAGLDRGTGGYVWSAFVIAIAPVAVATAAFFAKRKEQRRTET